MHSKNIHTGKEPDNNQPFFVSHVVKLAKWRLLCFSPGPFKCRLKCSSKFTQIQGQTIFDDYWRIGDVNKQRMFVASCLTNIQPRYK